MANFSPISAAIGGALIGLAAVLLMLFNGRIAGVSGIADGLVNPRTDDRLWRLTFIAGLVAAPLAAALAAGEPRTVDYRPSFVDGIGSKTVFRNMFEHARKLLDGSLVVTLDEAAQAMKLVAERNRVIVEGASACAIAAALSGRAGSGKVVAIVSGGNIDLEKFTQLVG